MDAAHKVVDLDSGERPDYEKLLIATGGSNRRPAILGMDLEGICQLRTVADCDRIRQEIAPGRKAAVVGMGFVGSEVAASLRRSGVEVTVVDRNKVPLRRVLGEEVGRVMEGIHREHGVGLIFEDAVATFEGDGRVQRVTTRNGRSIRCDFVVVGLGVEPVTDLLVDTGVKIDNGIVVDEHCRTSVEWIYAAGGCACLIFLLAAVAGCGTSGGGGQSESTEKSAGSETKTISVKESEYKLKPSNINLKKPEPMYSRPLTPAAPHTPWRSRAKASKRRPKTSTPVRTPRSK